MYSKPIFRRRARRVYPELRSASTVRSDSVAPSVRAGLIVAVGVFVLFVVTAAVYVRRVSTDIALSNARDVITARVNDAVLQTLAEGDYEGDYFVTFQKSDSGEIAAVSCNMAHINAFTSRLLEIILGAEGDGSITVGIPIGNLTGATLLMGRGPKLPVKIMLLSSSGTEFSNSVVTAGINQTKHQINLTVRVDMDLLLPWGTEHDKVQTEVLIADTVIVGKVPDTYLNMQQTKGG